MALLSDLKSNFNNLECYVFSDLCLDHIVFTIFEMLELGNTCSH